MTGNTGKQEQNQTKTKLNRGDKRMPMGLRNKAEPEGRKSLTELK